MSHYIMKHCIVGCLPNSLMILIFTFLFLSYLPSIIETSPINVNNESIPKVNGSPPTQQQIDNFNKFIQNCLSSHPNPPFKEPKIYVNDAGEMGIGTFASEDIKKEDVYIFLPWNCVMSVESFLKDESNFARKVSQFFGFSHEMDSNREIPNSARKIQRRDDFHIILFYLLHERSKLRESFFFPYIDLLPKYFETPYYWKEEHLQLLKGSEILTDVYVEKKTIQNTFNNIKSRLLDPNPELFPQSLINFKLYEWAFHILNSRTIWLQNTNQVRSLVPLLDAINCKELTNPNRLHISTRDLTANSVVTRSPDSFKKDEQVFENYGSDNHQNFFSHGFILQPNSHDCVKVKFSFEDKMQVFHKKFEERGIPHYETACIRRGVLPDRISRYIHVVSKIIGKEFNTILFQIITSKIANYQTTLQEDKQALQNFHVLPIERQKALQFLANEKALLHDILKDLRGKVYRDL